MSSGFSCHIDDKLSDEVDEVPSVVLNRPSSPPSWVHVFSKSSSTTSLRSAAAANMVVKSPKVLHRRSRCAKKKQQNSEKLLQEVRKDLGDQVDCNRIGEDCVPFADGYVLLVD